MSILARSTCSPVGELAAAHPVEQIEVFLDGTVPVWAFRARLRQRAPAGADFLGALAVHIRLAVTDELLGERIQLIEVVGSVIFPIVPFAAEPVHVFTDGSTYSVSSFTGLVSSKRRLHSPPYSCANPKLMQMDLAWPMCR